ncbi:hypothetical protein RHSIM_Rhsim09G0134900 [Rhododendron simsii]|uniref:Pentatricopeptide repeat-containing protein n=1 Tax=Rhododendron simsii TaxID=118357 RepID=A0A834LF34_RHOSS|nr:hypothetical protein RHSIM_Rhsim09G0134900 [Rhododendron simsii]
MIALGTQPNAVTLVSVLPACAGLEFFNLGSLIHGYAVKLGVDSDISLTNTLIALYGKCGIVDTAKCLFDQMPVHSLVSWNSMIATYEQNNAGGNAIQLFHRMEIENIEFDYITMVTVISACANLGALNTRKWVHELVRSRGLETNLANYEFIHNMPSEPNSYVWGALLGACRIHGNLELAEIVADRLYRLEPQTVSFYVLMANMYAEAGRWEDVARLRKLMEERELKKKIPGHSFVQTTDVSASNWGFVIVDQRTVQPLSVASQEVKVIAYCDLLRFINTMFHTVPVAIVAGIATSVALVSFLTGPSQDILDICLPLLIIGSVHVVHLTISSKNLGFILLKP